VFTAMLLLGTGLVILVFGAELLVRGAARLAAGLGIPALVIGLTVVAFGTSAPELAVSIKSAFAGQADIALGNVVGSNIFNVLFILGLAALITPLVVSQQLVRLDVPLMIAVSVLVLLLGLDGHLGRLDGALLFGGLIGYTLFLVRQSRRESAAVQAEYAQEYGTPGRLTRAQWLVNLALVLAGLALLVAGSRWLVDGAVAIARQFGVSELIIGLTIVAAGTSLPEVATSVVASLRGERDIAVGNVVGSNLFNLMSVLGLTSLIAPHGISVPAAALQFDIPVMIAVALACLPVFFTGHLIARWEGALFLGYYLAYMLYLILTVTRNGALPLFSAALIWFVIPLTVLTLVVVTLRALAQRRTGAGPGTTT
jgi:cation:H+ antiporter